MSPNVANAIRPQCLCPSTRARTVQMARILHSWNDRACLRQTLHACAPHDVKRPRAHACAAPRSSRRSGACDARRAEAQGAIALARFRLSASPAASRRTGRAAGRDLGTVAPVDEAFALFAASSGLARDRRRAPRAEDARGAEVRDFAQATRARSHAGARRAAAHRAAARSKLPPDGDRAPRRHGDEAARRRRGEVDGCVRPALRRRRAQGDDRAVRASCEGRAGPELQAKHEQTLSSRCASTHGGGTEARACCGRHALETRTPRPNPAVRRAAAAGDRG